MNNDDLRDYGLVQENIFKKSLVFIRKTWEINRKQIVWLLLVALFISIYVIQLFYQNIRLIVGIQNYIYYDPISALYFFFTNPILIVIGLVCTVAIFMSVIAYWVVRKKGYVYDPTIGVNIAASGEGGNAHFMTEEEKEAFFYRTKDIMKTKRLILGIDDDKQYCAINEKLIKAPNMAFIGAAGSGKTTTIIFPFIMQCVRLGDSFVTTDSKGDVYRETAYIAKKMGYEIRVINLKPDEMKNSNGVDFFKTIHNETQAMTLTSIIMDNTDGDEKEPRDFWFKCEYNLLLGLILYVIFNQAEKNLVGVYDLLIKQGVTGVEELCKQAKPENPYYAALRTFNGSREQVKESAYQGLCVRFSKISPAVVKKILTSDELDFRLPMSKKCAYYFIIPDIVNSYRFLSCMLFTTMFNELTDEYDRRFNGTGRTPIHVRFILDEFKGVGAIPNFGGILSVTRSRKLHVYYILQDLSQLKELYGEDQKQEILTNTAVKVLLSNAEPDTLKYFSSLTGEITVVTESKSFTEAKMDPIKLHPAVNISQRLQKRALLTPSDIQGILSDVKTDKMLAIVNGHTTILNKFHYWEHPFYKIMKEHNEQPSEYIPEWRAELLKYGEDVSDPFEDLEKIEKERKRARAKINPENAENGGDANPIKPRSSGASGQKDGDAGFPKPDSNGAKQKNNEDDEGEEAEMDSELEERRKRNEEARRRREEKNREKQNQKAAASARNNDRLKDIFLH